MSVELYREMFSDNVKELYGLPERSVLINVCEQEYKMGESVGIDGLKANDATATSTNALSSRKDFEGVGDFDAYKETLTPYTGTTKQRSWVSPYTIEAADFLSKSEDILRGIDIKSPTMKSLMRSVWVQEDQLVINALGAASVLRDDANGDKTAVSLLSSQEYTTANSGFIDVDDLSLIDALFRDEYIADEKYLVVNPTQVAKMKNNNRDYFQDVDFIGRMGALVDGQIEKAEGFTIIVSPLVPVSEFYAFAKSAVVVNNWTGIESKIDVLPHQRYVTQLYINRDVNAVRADDQGVIVGTIQ